MNKVEGNPRNVRRKGIALFVALAILVILGLTFFALSSHSIRIKQQTTNLLEERISQEHAYAFAKCYWAAVEQVCRKKSGCPKLFPGGGNPGDSGLLPEKRKSGLLSSSGLVIDHRDLNLSSSFALLSNEFDIEDLEVKGTWKASQTSSDPMLDMLRGRISLKVAFKPRFRKKVYEFVFSREFRIEQFLPPVVSKFTLFIRDYLDPKNPDPEQYNILSKSFQKESVGKPLTLFHRATQEITAFPADSWKSSGWVFLGGEKGVNLNLDGTSPHFPESEMFLFFPRQAFPSPNTDVPTVQCQIPNAHQSLKLRITPMGCYSEIETDSRIFNLLIDPDFAETLPLGKVSALRLFGDKTDRSPTRVLGKVFARFILWTALIVDENDDGIPEKSEEGLIFDDFFKANAAEKKIKLVFPLPRVTKPEKYQPPGYPQITSKSPNLEGSFSINPFIRFSGKIPAFSKSWKELSPALDAGRENDYVNYMTKIAPNDFGAKGSPTPGRMGTFNGLYDIFFEGSTSESRSFPPAPKLESGDYPNPGENFPLTDFIPMDSKGSRVTNKVPKLSEFDLYPLIWPPKEPSFFSHQFGAGITLEKSGLLGDPPGKTLKQPCYAFFENDLDLGPTLSLETSAVLVSKGNIKVGNVKKGGNDPYRRLLVLISLGGTIQCSGRQENVALVALRGSVGWKSLLDVSGSVAMKSMNIESLRGCGGSIRYDPTLDPTNPRERFLGLNVILGPGIVLEQRK